MGNPGKRAINHREPKPLLGAPKMPKYLDAQAKREWKRLCPVLVGMRVLSEVDAIALANLCCDYSLLQQATSSLERTGLLTKNKKTEMIHANPLLAVVGVTRDRVSRGLREFGMTPASRSRVQALPEDQGMDPIERALCDFAEPGPEFSRAK